jgi:AcrR family transcriptional regulator
MTKLIKRQTRSRRRSRKSRGDATHRTSALYEAGSRLLSRYDFDDVSMARLAKESGCAVGTLYDRFDNKEAFLRRLSGATFHTLREDAAAFLDSAQWRRENTEHIISQIVHHIVSRMTTRRAAGVIRAAVKLGATDTLTREFFEDYRKDATEHVVKLLVPRLRYGGAARVRIAMQIIFATVTDAILHKKPGPIQAGSTRMIDALSNIMCGYLGIANSDWAGDEADGEDELDEEFESETEPEVPDGHIPLYDPDLRVYRGVVPNGDPRKKRLPPSRKGRIVEQETTKVVTPPRVPTQPSEPENIQPFRKRRHKVI